MSTVRCAFVAVLVLVGLSLVPEGYAPRTGPAADTAATGVRLQAIAPSATTAFRQHAGPTRFGVLSRLSQRQRPGLAVVLAVLLSLLACALTRAGDCFTWLPRTSWRHSFSLRAPPVLA